MTAPALHRTSSPLPITWPEYVPPPLRPLVADDERISAERRTLMEALAAARADERYAQQRDVQARATSVRDRTAMPEQTHQQQNRALQQRLAADVEATTEALWQVRTEAAQVLHGCRDEWLLRLRREADDLRGDLLAAAEAYVKTRTRLAEVAATAAFVDRFPHKPQRIVRTLDVMVPEVPGGSVSFLALSQALLADADFAYSEAAPPLVSPAAARTAPEAESVGDPEGLVVTGDGVFVLPDAG